jgi:hypothetical protein
MRRNATRAKLGLAAVLILAGAWPACSSSSGAATTTSAPGSSGGGGAGKGGAGGLAHAGGAGFGGEGGSLPLPAKFTVQGVVTDGSKPVGGALVMQAGGKPSLTTGPDGSYSIELTQAIPGTPTVVASKLGYRTVGVEFYDLPDGPVELALRYVTPPDNEGYKYGAPGVGIEAKDNSTAYCGHCHTRMTAQFQETGHRDATREASVQDLYAGVSEAHADEASCKAAGGVWRVGLVPGTAGDSAPKCYLGGGVLPDLNGCGAPGGPSCDDPALPAGARPTAFGACADCHAPGIEGHAGGRNLHDAVGLAYDFGNHCDVCHHIADVDLTKPAGLGGAVKLQRPHDTIDGQIGSKLLQALYSPLPDVPNAFMGGVYQPLFSKSELCGGCHEQRQAALVPGTKLDPSRWPKGLPTHSTYSEWAASSFDKPDTQCQACHMPPDDSGLKSTVDVTDATNASITFGFLRPPEQIRQHVFLEALDGSPRLIDAALAASVAASSDGTVMGAVPTLRGWSPQDSPRHQNLWVNQEGSGRFPSV